MGFNLQEEILKYLNAVGDVDTLDIAVHFKTDHQKIIGAVNSIQALGELVSTEAVSHQKWELTEEGTVVADKGSHEARTFYAISPEGMPLKDLKVNLPDKNLHSVGFSKAMARGWICVDKSGEVPVIRQKVSSIKDIVKDHMNLIRQQRANEVEENAKQDYKKRKLVNEVILKSYILRKGNEFRTSVSKPETDLTSEMISNGSWKEKSFKSYNFDALGTPLDCGHLHPLLKVRAEFRRIFLEMGFTEMPTNNYIESSFWNFDALFQPQQHPARDAHDTFFVSDPQYTKNFPSDYLERVKCIHSNGGFGSQGYGYNWKIAEAQKNLLRTHTTAVSARMLYKLAQEGFKPVKYFSIDRVFRNETLDATHLAEFHQVEGVVADYRLTLGDLIGILAEFFKKLGMSKLQFKPAYNPYTEPSMEIFSFHDGLGKWMEVGNSGMFRPEMLRPMGIPEEVNVIAWGLSLERPTMIKYGINNIRDLVGPKVDLQMVHDSPICRLEKNKSHVEITLSDIINMWNSVHSKLEKLQQQVNRLSHNVDVITNGPKLDGVCIPNEKYCSMSMSNFERLFDMKIVCNPQFPLFSFQFLLKYLSKLFTFDVNVETEVNFSQCLKLFNSVQRKNNLNSCPNITFLWKDVPYPVLLFNTTGKEIFGEVNIARYFSRLIETKDPVRLYEKCGTESASEIDEWLDKIDLCSRQINITDLENTVELHLSKYNWVVGNELTLADICLWSFLKQMNRSVQKVSVNVNKFIKRIDNISVL
ncbi:phenylalanine--tRNA ligase alpha subunit [Schistocerca piceifrons]|uniref:phenylalanine--tRNA ligase alpha subunit n=1 Tax=Schistocerca piceifrons TaxID=274613 RepID=UPI001F5F5DE3|nr:phenylalanine--tRNA ligase alpha subunit [Schistocerca piceifrons]